MEDTSSNENEIIKLEYNGNKDIKMVKKGKTPKKKESVSNQRKTPLKEKPEPIPVLTEKEIWEKWVKENRKEFFNAGKKEREFILNVYKAYNAIFNTNKSPGKCGICDWNIILDIKQRYF